MRIEPRTDGNVLILDLFGDVTMRNCQMLQEAFTDATRQGRHQLALNFSLVPTIDSAGLATLVEIVQLARKQKVGLCFFSLSEHVRAVMEITHLDQILPVAQDETTALAELGE